MFGTMRSKLISKAALPAVLAAVIVGAAGGWFANAGSVRAPEPARLTSTLGPSPAGAFYIVTRTATTAYYLSNTTWTASNIPAGLPCSSKPGLAAGTTVYGTVVAAGNYRRCSQ